MYASSQYNNIIGISQKLRCTIKFQAFLVYLNPPNGVLTLVLHTVTRANNEEFCNDGNFKKKTLETTVNFRKPAKEFGVSIRVNGNVVLLQLVTKLYFVKF